MRCSVERQLNKHLPKVVKGVVWANTYLWNCQLSGTLSGLNSL